MNDAEREKAAEEFSKEARRFVQWVQSDDSEHAFTVPVALRMMLSIYTAALKLPRPWSSGVSEEDFPMPESTSEQKEELKKRVGKLPFRHYGVVYDSTIMPPEEAVVGDIIDDILDSYGDLLEGLYFYDAGKISDAVWQWGYMFRTHWGEHATSAIRALHVYLSMEYWDGLTSEN